MVQPKYTYALSPGDMMPPRLSSSKTTKRTCQCCGSEYEASGRGCGRTRYCVDCRGLSQRERKALMSGVVVSPPKVRRCPPGVSVVRVADLKREFYEALLRARVRNLWKDSPTVESVDGVIEVLVEMYERRHHWSAELFDAIKKGRLLKEALKRKETQ